MTPADLELRPKKFHDLVSMGFPRDFHGSLEFGIETRKNANGFSMILFNLELKNMKTPWKYFIENSWCYVVMNLLHMGSWIYFQIFMAFSWRIIMGHENNFQFSWCFEPLDFRPWKTHDSHDYLCHLFWGHENTMIGWTISKICWEG